MPSSQLCFRSLTFISIFVSRNHFFFYWHFHFRSHKLWKCSTSPNGGRIDSSRNKLGRRMKRIKPLKRCSRWPNYPNSELKIIKRFCSECPCVGSWSYHSRKTSRLRWTKDLWVKTQVSSSLACFSRFCNTSKPTVVLWLASLNSRGLRLDFKRDIPDPGC